MRRSAFPIVLLLTISSFVQTFGQSELPVTNETIKYKIIRTSLRFVGEKTVIPSKYLIQVELNDATKARLRKLKKQQWVALLNNETYDWAANLLLYDLFERDAIPYHVLVKDRNTWLEKLKTEEIAYWSTYLKE